MERTESKVIRVPPAIEDARIEEMAIFGWNLQNRQDVVVPLGARSTVYHDEDEDEVDTDIQSRHYVVLHFVRPLTLPNLKKVEELEREYFASQPHREGTKGGGCGLWFLPVVFFMAALGALSESDGPYESWARPVAGLLMGIAALILFGLIAGSINKDNKEKEYQRKRGEWPKRREELRREAKLLLSNIDFD